MKTKAAVLYEMGGAAPYHDSAPLPILGGVNMGFDRLASASAVRQLIGFQS